MRHIGLCRCCAGTNKWTKFGITGIVFVLAPCNSSILFLQHSYHYRSDIKSRKACGQPIRPFFLIEGLPAIPSKHSFLTLALVAHVEMLLPKCFLTKCSISLPLALLNVLAIRCPSDTTSVLPLVCCSLYTFNIQICKGVHMCVPTVESAAAFECVIAH